MTISTFVFENQEDLEMAFHNIVKWYDSKVVERVENLSLNIRASQDVFSEVTKIIEKHSGARKSRL